MTEAEKNALDLIKQRYDYHRGSSPLLEGTINLVVVSPLLQVAGFLEPPFKIRSPESNKPIYGIATNGDSFVFVKLSRSGKPEYDVSDAFLLLPRRNRFYDVLRIFKRLALFCHFRQKRNSKRQLLTKVSFLNRRFSMTSTEEP